VEDPYEEEGITIRHYGKLSNLHAVNQTQLSSIARSFRGGFVDFALWNGRNATDTSAFAYCLALRTAVVGYEGIAFDVNKIFLLDPVWRDSIARPEQVTYKHSPDQPQLDPQDPQHFALVRWDASWPEPDGWRGWKLVQEEGREWLHRTRIISILQRSSHAYYHFLAESLPKMFLVLQDFQEHADSVFLLDTSFANTWSLEMMQLLGISADRCLVRQPGKLYFADTLHIPTPTPLHRAYPTLLLRLRKLLLQGALGGDPKRVEREEEGRAEVDKTIVFILRKPSNNQHSHQYSACLQAGGCKVREIVNAEDVMKAIRNSFDSYRLLTFDSTGMSCRDQISMFSAAHVIIGTHGAGLTNVMFAPAGGTVIELLPFFLLQSSITTIFWHVSTAVGLDHRTYPIPREMMEPDNATSLHNFRVPLKDFLRHLREHFEMKIGLLE